MRPLTPLDAFAALLILAVFIGGIIGTFLRAQPRNDACRERANADRRSPASDNCPCHSHGVTDA